MSDTPLQGRTAIVTGASSGIGRVIAEALAGAGAYVFLAGRSEAPMLEAVERIRAAGGEAEAVSMDMRRIHDIEGLVQRAVDLRGALHIMVNNAGLGYPAPITEGDPEEWREMFEVNLLGLLVGCQAAVRAMRQTGSEGHIVNISSIAAQRADSGVYGATKHAVNAISATLRGELEDDPIRVVNVMPGAYMTNFARNMDPEMVRGVAQMAGVELEHERGQKIPDDVIEAVLPKLQQVVGDPRDVAEAVLFAVTQPVTMNVMDITVRPPKALSF